MKRKSNCWEQMQCGREPGGARVAELGVCPASQETRLDKIHGGHNAGRACWAVAGTFCSAQVGGVTAQKLNTCVECSFFGLVQREEGEEFHMSALLESKLHGPPPPKPARHKRTGHR